MGMIAAFLGAIAAAAPIVDVTVADDELVSTLTVECGGPCAVEPHGRQSFYIRGASADFDIDTRAASNIVTGMRVEPTDGGAILNVRTVTSPELAEAKPCGPARLCFSFVMARPEIGGSWDSFERLGADLDRLNAATGGGPSLSAAGEISCDTAQASFAHDPLDLGAYRRLTECLAPATGPIVLSGAGPKARGGAKSFRSLVVALGAMGK